MPTKTKKQAQKPQKPEKKILDIRPGYTVKIYQRIHEGKKQRLQAFEGIVIARKHGSEPGATIIVRRETGGFGVERIFPLHSPTIEKIEVLKKYRVRRAKLYYLRQRAGRKTRLKDKIDTNNKPPKLVKTSAKAV